MKIKFFLPYITQPGQNIYISGSSAEMGNFETDKAVPMQYLNGIWNCEVNFENTTSFKYSYILKDDYSGIMPEAGPARTFLPGIFSNYHIHDQWRPFSDESPFLSNAFRNIFYKSDNIRSIESAELIITCSANNISENETLVISGNAEILGKWDENKSFEMSRGDSGIWHASFHKTDFSGDTEYKFIVKSILDKSSVYKWEEGLNRQISDLILKSPANTSVIINNFSVNLSAGKPKFSGTAIPVFSIRTNDGCGIGEFSSLKKLADLLFVTRQRVLQILPVNDTSMSHTWTDSYPYGAISIFALHPLYVNLKEIGLVEDKTFMKYFKEESARLEALEEIDYDSVDKLKWD
jgi:4-alpha-glucanotransferase